MKPVLYAFAVLAIGCAPHIDPGPIPVEQRNTLHVLAQPDDASPNIYLQALVRAGSATDPVGREGVAHLVAQSLVDAGAGDRSSVEVRDALYVTGNRITVGVDREWVRIRLRCHRDHADLCIELFSDALLSPRFDEGDVFRLRDDATYSVEQGLMSNEEALGHEVLESVLFQSHPYGHPPRGRSGVLPLLTVDHLRQFHASHYVRETVYAGIGGGFTAEQHKAFEARLGVLKGQAAPELILLQPQPVSERSLTLVETQTLVTGIHFGHPIAVDRNDPDWWPLTLGMTALGQHRQSFGRLFRTLRTDRGLNYGTYSYIEPYVQRGWSSLPENGVVRSHPYFYVWIRPTSTENGPFALKLAIDETESLIQEGLTESEFERTRDYLLGWVPLLAQDPGRRLAFALESAATGTPNLLEALPDAFEGIDAARVQQALQDHIDLDRVQIVAVTGEAEAFANAVIEESATPIVYSDVQPDAEQAKRDERVAQQPLNIPNPAMWRVQAQGIFR